MGIGFVLLLGASAYATRTTNSWGDVYDREMSASERASLDESQGKTCGCVTYGPVTEKLGSCCWGDVTASQPACVSSATNGRSCATDGGNGKGKVINGIQP